MHQIKNKQRFQRTHIAELLKPTLLISHQAVHYPKAREESSEIVYSKVYSNNPVINHQIHRRLPPTR